MGDSHSKESGNKRLTCDIKGCVNDRFENGFCEECLNDMAHGALDLAGVP